MDDPTRDLEIDVIGHEVGHHVQNLLGYDVTPDGKRFLISTANRPDAAFTPELTVVTNWDAVPRK